MMKNVGPADKVIRVIAGIVLAVLVLAEVITGVAAIITGIVAGVLLITGLTGVCPAYSIFRIKTIKKVS
jgi:hypothetical protein